MNAIAATFEPEEEQEGTGSVTGPASLSQLERIFCDVFVGNGGNAKEAAIAAGADPEKAAVQACRWLCKRRVADHIFRLCQRLVQASLPIAIKALIDIAADAEAQRKDRIKAATSLLEHGGMAAPKGGVQVNVGVAVNGQQAQQIIGSVWDARQARLSGIPPAMTDTLQSDLDDIERLTINAEPATPGGDQIQGPGAGSAPVPPPSSEHSPISDVSRPAAVDAFRAAFDDGEDDAD